MAAKKIRSSNLHYLPEEIISDILLTVSISDQSRFKTVCKLWNSLISSPEFKNQALVCSQSHPPPEERVIFTTVRKPNRFNKEYSHSYFGLNKYMSARRLDLSWSFSKHDINHKVLLLQSSCKGLLLLQDRYRPNQLHISNPVTSLCQTLPPAPTFDLCNFWSLVYDTSIEKFKLFGISDQMIYLALTQGDEGHWRTLLNPTTTLDNSWLFSQVILVEKELHWLTSDMDQNELCLYVYSLHIETEEVTKTKFPACEASVDSVIHLSKMKNVLHLMSLREGLLCVTIVSPHQLELFVLADKVQSVWEKKGRIIVESPATFGNFTSENISLVSMANTVKVLIHDEAKLLLYDVQSQRTRQVAGLSKDHKLCKSYIFHHNSLINF